MPDPPGLKKKIFGSMLLFLGVLNLLLLGRVELPIELLQLLLVAMGALLLLWGIWEGWKGKDGRG